MNDMNDDQQKNTQPGTDQVAAPAPTEGAPAETTAEPKPAEQADAQQA